MPKTWSMTSVLEPRQRFFKATGCSAGSCRLGPSQIQEPLQRPPTPKSRRGEKTGAVGSAVTVRVWQKKSAGQTKVKRNFKGPKKKRDATAKLIVLELHI